MSDIKTEHPVGPFSSPPRLYDPTLAEAVQQTGRGALRDLDIAFAIATGRSERANAMLQEDFIGGRCAEIADQVVPEYRGGKPRSCTGHYAKRWQAAWDGACVALGGDPARYR